MITTDGAHREVPRVSSSTQSRLRLPSMISSGTTTISSLGPPPVPRRRTRRRRRSSSSSSSSSGSRGLSFGTNTTTHLHPPSPGSQKYHPPRLPPAKRVKRRPTPEEHTPSHLPPSLLHPPASPMECQVVQLHQQHPQHPHHLAISSSTGTGTDSSSSTNASRESHHSRDTTVHHRKKKAQTPPSQSNVAAFPFQPPHDRQRYHHHPHPTTFRHPPPLAPQQLFAQLDPTDPVQAQRIAQRQRMIAKGKNTVGYDAYRAQVPPAQRHAYSRRTPTTPDATLDIPTKRWQGLVRAWRKALHQYDPPDLVAASRLYPPSSSQESSAAWSTTSCPAPGRASPDAAEIEKKPPAASPWPQLQVLGGGDDDDDDEEEHELRRLEQRARQDLQAELEAVRPRPRWGDMDDEDEEEDDDELL